MKKVLFVLLFAVVFVLPQGADAVEADGYKYGIGLSGGPGVSGLSGTMEMGGNTSLQLVAGTGALVKGRWAFVSKEVWDIYGALYGGVRTGWDDLLIAGGGVGWDFSFQTLDAGIPPISLYLEADFGLVSSGDVDFDFNGGLHFNFDL